MGRVFFPILSLAGAAMMALVLGAVAQDYVGLTADAVWALSAAGLLMAAVAAGTLLKRK